SIFLKTLARVSDRTNKFRFDIGASADEIDHLILFRIEEHAVDGEVAPLGVFFRRRESRVHRMSMIVISAVRPKRRDFEIESILDHNHNAEVRADGISMRKDLLDD